jgi:hypothetical protein
MSLDEIIIILSKPSSLTWKNATASGICTYFVYTSGDSDHKGSSISSCYRERMWVPVAEAIQYLLWNELNGDLAYPWTQN